jgi:signal transduction histidine kinase
MFKRVHNIRITEKLVLYFVIIGIGTTAIAGFFAFYSMKKTLLNRAFEQITDIRSVKKKQIEDFFQNRVRDIDLLAASSDISTVSQGVSKINRPEYSSYHAQYIFASGYYSGLLYCDYQHFKEWSVFAGKDSLDENIAPFNKNHRLFFLQEHFENHADAIFVDYSKHPNSEFNSLYLAAPFHSKNKQNEGFIALQIPLEVINSIVMQASREGGFGESGETYLVGQDFLMRSNSRFHTNSVMQTYVKTIATEKAFAEGEGLKIVQDYRNIKVLSSFSLLKIAGLNWIILTEIDFREVLFPVVQARNQLLLISGVIGCFVFLIAWFLASKITKPLLELNNAAQKMSEGLFPLVAPGTAKDEINELMTTFNIMSTILQQKQKQLEDEKNKRLSAVIEGQDKERKRLALDIHDGLIQSLVALKFHAELYSKSDAVDAEKIVQGLKQIISEAREISNDLMPAVLHEFGLLTALKQLCSRMNQHTGTYIDFETSGNFSFDHRTSTFLYRIAQEGLSNAVKHSQSDKIYVQFIELQDYYLLLIEDKGTGFEIDSVSAISGNGIANMKERVAALKGVIEFQSNPEGGTTIHIRIPKQ